jgi:hypothetical protein
MKTNLKIPIMKKFEDLSIADLKAAWDFVKMDLKELEQKAKEESINPSRIGAYDEVKKIEFELYHELLNRTRVL